MFFGDQLDSRAWAACAIAGERAELDELLCCPSGSAKALLGSSTRTMAHQEAWRAAATILCYHADRLSEDRQQWLLDTLKVASKYTDNNVLRGPGPPPLINLIALKPPGPWLRPVDVEQKQVGSKQARSSANPSSPTHFITVPFLGRATRAEWSVWVQRELR